MVVRGGVVRGGGIRRLERGGCRSNPNNYSGCRESFGSLKLMIISLESEI